MLHHGHYMREVFVFYGGTQHITTSLSKNFDAPPWQTKSWCAKLKTLPWKFDLLVHLLALGVGSSFTSSSGGLAWSRLGWRRLNLLTATCDSQSTCNPGNPGSHPLWKWVIGPSSCSGPQLCYCANGLYIDIPVLWPTPYLKFQTLRGAYKRPPLNVEGWSLQRHRLRNR